MRERQFLQSIHFNAVDGVSQSVPIVLPCDEAQKKAIESQPFITLTFEGKDMAIMTNPEVYDHVKGEPAAAQRVSCQQSTPVEGYRRRRHTP